MKKFSVILLVAILAMACVFADDVKVSAKIAGSATATYTLNLDDATYYYVGAEKVAKPTVGNDVTFSIEPILKTSATADGVYGYLAAKLNFAPTTKFEELNSVLYLTDMYITKPGVWKLNLLGSDKIGNFAFVSATNAGSVPALTVADVSAASAVTGDPAQATNIKGVSFVWNMNAKQAFTFLGAANRKTAKSDGEYILAAQTPAFTLIEGEDATKDALSIKGFGGFHYLDGWTLLGSVELKSNTEVAVITASMDNELYNLAKGAKVKYDMDAKINAKFGPYVSYMANPLATTATTDYFAEGNLFLSKNAAARLTMNADVTFKTRAFNVDSFAPVTLKLSCTNILAEDKDDRNFGVDASVVLDKNYTVTAYAHNILYTGATVVPAAGDTTTKARSSAEVGAGVDIIIGDAYLLEDSYYVDSFADIYYAIGDKEIGYTLGAEFGNEWLTADLSIDNSFECVKGGEKHLTIGASASTDYIPNTVLKLEYKGLDLLKGYTDPEEVAGNGIGTVVASCKISF